MLHLIKMWLEAPSKKPTSGATTRARPQPRGETRHPPGLTHLAAAVESLYAPVRVGMEAAGTRRALQGANRQLCRRLCDLLQGQRVERCTSCADRGSAATDGQRGEDSLCRVPREHFDFLGYTFGRYYSSGRVALTRAPGPRRRASVARSSRSGRGPPTADPDSPPNKS